LVSPFDVRVFSIIGIALAITREMELSLDTVAGKAVHQDIPLDNPSSEIWTFKTQLSGNAGFTIPPWLTVSPNSVGMLNLGFTSRVIGNYRADLTLTNLTKESVGACHITASVVEPPAQEKIMVICKARETFVCQIALPSFITNRLVKVTSTVSIIEFPIQVSVAGGKPKVPFEFTVLALRSGVATGDLKFTCANSHFFCWYVNECQIEPPRPEAIIDVETEARKTVTVEIPLSNSSDRAIAFEIEHTTNEFFRPHSLTIPP
jgi:hypothetical protein